METTNNFWTAFPEKDSCQKFRYIVEINNKLLVSIPD